MVDEKKPSRWEELKESQVSKTTLVWSCVGSVVVALVIGFTLGGWVTGGTAREMQETAGQEGRFDLASAICVENFMAQPDARERLIELQEINSTFRQRQFIESGDWAVMPGRESASRQAADLCARVLSNLEIQEFEMLEESESLESDQG
ncbi:hypothetical protein [Pararhodobacter sp. SW119]|uniref:hypothetical protein n=1 Tax=Pararhodobacter sp. SW119 TaxID=2780075 RepID=UPI001ADFBBB5|nr:hypothetical protein [Pararhodobacter sp. SW119]